mgnify:CR=1 FL=1
MSAIDVKLNVFEGPLDLLLHLIEKNKVNIYDIPIGTITEQYLEYVTENCMNSAFNKDIAAAHFGFHPDYFGALFKKATGKTFVTVLNELRMEEARVLLTTTHLKVYEIAEQVGIEDVKYFLRLFKKAYDASPNEYRYAHRRE